MSHTKFVAFEFLLLAIVALHYTNATFEPNVMCSLLPSNTKIKDPRACNTWIQCIDGEPHYGTCDDGEFYDRETELCVQQSSIECISSDPCAATPGTNGFVADPYSCNGYYYCNNGNAAHGECSSGLNFNPGTQDCIRNFPCKLKMNPDNYCNIVPDGVFIKDPSSCKAYQLCWEGVVVNRTCPDYFYFNVLNGKCDYPTNVECAESTSNPPDLPSTDVCAKVGDFVSDEHSCNGYYYCRAPASGDGGIELEYGTCPAGRFFDPTDGGSCVPRTSIACQYDRCVGLGDEAIQLANESDDGCAGFAICQSGERIGAATCPDNGYFDELIQRCTSEVINFPACALSEAEDTTEATADTTE